MVNLNHTDQRAPRYPRSHHNWGVQFGRVRREIIAEPRGLEDLEELARRTVVLMEQHSSKSEHNYERAMGLLREQYNMNFMLLCKNCHGLHGHDEMMAPER